MLYNDIDKMIADSLKSGDAARTRVFRLIKTELVRSIKDNGPLTEVAEAKILMKMAQAREESVKIYNEAGRNDLAQIEKDELEILKAFVPQQASEEEVSDYVRASLTAYKLTKEDGYKLSMKDMKPIMEIVRAKYPSADGKLISSILKEVI